MTSYTAIQIGDTLDVGTHTVTLRKAGFYNIGLFTNITGGTLSVPGGLSIQPGNSINAHGTINGRIAALAGSTINATGNLTLGPHGEGMASVAGFFSDGELYTDWYEVVIHDQNEAVLGSLTRLGGSDLDSEPGTLTAGSADPNDTYSHFLLEQGKNLVGRGTVNGHFKNHGHVIGDGPGDEDRIRFSADWTVTGKGTFENTTILGTFAPGESPAIAYGKNQAFGGTVEIELGGSTPGFGDNNHDQIVDAAEIWLLGATTLSVVPWNGFLPAVGNEFTIITWQDEIVGQFDALSVDPYFTSQGLAFGLEYVNPGGAGSLVLSTYYSADFDEDGDVDGFDFLAWQRGFGITSGASHALGDADRNGAVDAADLAMWNGQLGMSARLAAAEMAVPEPSSALLFVLAAYLIGFVLGRRIL